MKEWQKNLYFAEFLLVAVSSAFFILGSLFLLLGLATAVARSAALLLPIWIGGAMGTYALWSLYFKIYDERSGLRVDELPWFTLTCGMLANLMGVVFFIFQARGREDVLLSLVGLIPIAIAVHWTYILMKLGGSANKPSNSPLHSDASRQ